MEITLTQELEKWIQEQVETGRYQTPSEVVEALIRQVRLVELREKLKVGINQLNRGEKIQLTRELVKDIKRRGRERRKIHRKGKQRPR